MNFGSSIKKIAANINASLKICKVTGGCRPRCAGIVHDTLKIKNDSVSLDQLKSLSLCLSHKENVFFSFPKTDVAIKKSIIEPDEGTKIKVELPLGNTRNEALELPFHIEKEISEPKGQVIIIKEAVHMLVIRRRKMKKHKRKKHIRKYRVQIQTRKIRRRNRKENALVKRLHLICAEADKFSAKNYVRKKLDLYNWVRPVTHVRGILAPKWVIKEHLENEEEKKVFRQRVEECINSRK